MIVESLRHFLKTESAQTLSTFEDRPIKALVVDDNDFDRRIMKRCLNTHPNVIHVHGSANAFQALEYIMINKMRPDIIFIDVAMPVIGGSELLMSLRRELEDSSCKIVLMSSLKMLDPESSRILETADSFLPKPYSVDEMTTALHAYVDSVISGENWPEAHIS